tara:strand:+ start:129 stop:356 length:228 start_codon:yes stop_codon:yes gene_type:complete
VPIEGIGLGTGILVKPTKYYWKMEDKQLIGNPYFDGLGFIQNCHMAIKYRKVPFFCKISVLERTFILLFCPKAKM